MRRLHRHRRPVQLEMFQTRSPVPHWPMLPLEVKRWIQPLLARLLKEHYVGRAALAGEREDSDE